MPLKCRCVCSCKLLVSEKSAGKTIKCPKCARRLRVPTDAVQRREQQIAARQNPAPRERSKLKLPLSSLVDLPEPAPPPIVERLDLREAVSGEPEPLSASLVNQVLAIEPAATSDQTDEPERAASRVKPPPLPVSKASEPETKLGAEGTPAEVDAPKADAIATAPKSLTAAPSISRPTSEAPSAPLVQAKSVTVEEPVAPPIPPIDDKPVVAQRAKAAPPRSASPPVSPPTRKPTSPPLAQAPALGKPESPLPKKQGYLLDRDRLDSVRWLACSVLGLAIVGIAPAAWDIAEYFQSTTALGLSRWAYALLLIGLVQAAYAVYLLQLPDWSSVWVVTVVSLIIAAGYAIMLGLTLLASHESYFIQVFDLTDRLRGGQATLWCLIMLSLTSLLSYLSSRVATRWQRAFAS